MTAEDQDAAIGRLVARFSEAKRRRSALIAEARKHADAISPLVEGMRGLEFYTAFWHGREDGYSRNKKDLVVPATFPTAEKITMLLDELRATAKELRELRPLIKDAGIELE